MLLQCWSPCRLWHSLGHCPPRAVTVCPGRAGRSGWQSAEQPRDANRQRPKSQRRNVRLRITSSARHVDFVLETPLSRWHEFKVSSFGWTGLAILQMPSHLRLSCRAAQVFLHVPIKTHLECETPARGRPSKYVAYCCHCACR